MTTPVQPFLERGQRPIKIWERKKRQKFGAMYDNFRVWAPISLKQIETSTSWWR